MRSCSKPLGMLDGQVLYTDSTHLKANANQNKHDEVQVPCNASAYLQELEDAIDADHLAAGKKPFKPRDKTAGKAADSEDDDSGRAAGANGAVDTGGPGSSQSSVQTKRIKRSRTDLDSGYMVRDDKQLQATATHACEA